MNALERFKKDIKHRFFILSGQKETGKTRTALERAVFLQNNYCITDDDNILIISDQAKDIGALINEIKGQSYYENTLFSLINRDNIDIYCKKEFFHKCYMSASRSNNERFCDNDIVKGLIVEGIAKLRMDNFRLDKIIVPQNIEFLYEELLFMKEKNINNLDQYQALNRKHRGNSIRKNSKVRYAIYQLYDWYCNYMKSCGIVDYIDEFKYISSAENSNSEPRYTHIVIDNCEKITNNEVEFFRSLMNDSHYGNFIIVKDTGVDIVKPWRDYFKSIKSISLPNSEKFKTIIFRKKDDFRDRPRPTKKYPKKVSKCEEMSESNKATQLSISEMMTENISKNSNERVEDNMKENNYIDLYRYIDLKHNIAHDFAIDTSSYNEVILNQSTTSEVLGEDKINKVPVYNEIAAGEPISINDEMEGCFNIPIYWLKGVKQPFILKVKGDSMINASINDGDYVVINKQTVANNNDIVAVSIDGEATLKRLWIRGNKAVLMPENDKYYPIEIKEDNAYIIGKAVGLIKSIH